MRIIHGSYTRQTPSEMEILYGGITTLGGRGGIAGKDNMSYALDSAGDGGIAGKGGQVTVSTLAKVYAYNGNIVTDGKYNDIYEYDKDGNKTGIKLTTIEKNTGENFIPTKIFAQDGILRKVYKTNAWWGVKPNYNKEFFNKLFGDMVCAEVENATIANSINELKLICVREEKKIDAINYINKEGKTQGIGSGAGYIELDNGSYTTTANYN